MGAEVFHALKAELKNGGHNTNVGDEGGFAPNLPGRRGARIHHGRDRQGGYTPVDDVFLALDCAARVLQKRRYRLRARAGRSTPTNMPDYLDRLVDSFPIISHRGRHGGGRLGRLEVADRLLGDGSSSSATTCS